MKRFIKKTQENQEHKLIFYRITQIIFYTLNVATLDLVFVVVVLFVFL